MSKYDLALDLAVTSEDLDKEHADLIKLYNEEDIEVGLWPLMDHGSGYWVSEHNCKEYSGLLDEVFEFSKENDLNIDNIAVDLEPPVYQVLKIKNGSLPNKLKTTMEILKTNLNDKKFEEAISEFGEIRDKIKDHGAESLAAIFDLTMLDHYSNQGNFQKLLGTPVLDIKWDHVSPMLYGSVLKGYSKGVINQGDVESWIYSRCKDTRKIFGNRSAVSLGLTSTGEFENEPYYRKPTQLKPDVQAAKVAGVNEISIWGLEGILNSEDPEKWFKTISKAQPKQPKRSRKMEALYTLLKKLSHNTSKLRKLLGS